MHEPCASCFLCAIPKHGCTDAWLLNNLLGMSTWQKASLLSAIEPILPVASLSTERNSPVRIISCSAWLCIEVLKALPTFCASSGKQFGFECQLEL